MNFKQALTLAAEKLAALKDIDAPTFEAEVLLRHCLNLDRAALRLNLKQELSPGQCQRFFELVERRYRGEPAFYIIGSREFYGLDFEVDRRALIPRPETELLVEEALKLARSKAIRSIADIGTGSGAIAVSLAVNLPGNIRIYASDISGEALELARLNACKQAVEKRIIFLEGDLLDSLPQKVDLVIANLPYVSAAEVETMPSAQYEPRLALNGGETGLDQIFRLTGQLKSRIYTGGYVLIEIGLGQARAVTEHISRTLPGSVIGVAADLAGIERMVQVEIL